MVVCLVLNNLFIIIDTIIHKNVLNVIPFDNTITYIIVLIYYIS